MTEYDGYDTLKNNYDFGNGENNSVRSGALNHAHLVIDEVDGTVTFTFQVPDWEDIVVAPLDTNIVSVKQCQYENYETKPVHFSRPKLVHF